MLDNLEHLPGAAGPLAELLHRAPGVQLLVTSRRPLGLGVEWLVEVPGLPCPPDGTDAAGAAGYEAVQLFEERARLLRPGVESDVEGAARICAWWRACRSRSSWPPAGSAPPRRPPSPTGSPAASNCSRRPRPTWSPGTAASAQCSTRPCGLFRRASAGPWPRCRCPTGSDLAAAAAVADAGLPLLAGLVDQSLVTAGPDGRYAMHELLRQYAAGRLAEDPRRRRRPGAGTPPTTTRCSPPTRPRRRRMPPTCGPPPSGSPSPRSPARSTPTCQRIWTLYRRNGWFREAQAVLAAALRRDGVPGLYRGRWHRLLGEATNSSGRDRRRPPGAGVPFRARRAGARLRRRLARDVSRSSSPAGRCGTARRPPEARSAATSITSVRRPTS